MWMLMDLYMEVIPMEMVKLDLCIGVIKILGNNNKGWSATANLFYAEYSKTIRSEYLGTLQLADILTFMWIASKIDILLYSQTYEKKHF